MPMMKLSRSRTVHCLSGHSVAFKADEPVFVPPPAVAECMAVGAGLLEDFELDDDTAPAAPAGASDPAARKAAILEAFETLRKRDARGDFDAAGKPHPKAVSRLVGFRIEVKERDVMWAEVMESAGQ